MEQIEHESAVQGSFGLLPKRVRVGGVLGGSVLNEVVNEAEHVGVLADIAERVVAVGMAGVYQIEYPQDVTPFQQQRPHCPDDLALGVGHDVGGVC